MAAVGGEDVAKQIRHIALKAEDPSKLAEFYKSTFGMREVWRPETGGAVYLSDGYLNLALLPAHGMPEGLAHFGFQVDSMDETSTSATEAGARQAAENTPRDGRRYAEQYLLDPVGTRVDLSEKGWGH
jgi:catechol 2,3-dioxygenase-like lactoylglutathione lyase family enzyme